MEQAMHKATATGPVTEDSTTARLRELLAELLEMAPDAVDPEVPVSAYGIDSVSITLLTSELEQWCGAPLSRDILFSHPTVADMAAEVVRSLEQTDRQDAA